MNVHSCDWRPNNLRGTRFCDMARILREQWPTIESVYRATMAVKGPFPVPQSSGISTDVGEIRGERQLNLSLWGACTIVWPFEGVTTTLHLSQCNHNKGYIGEKYVSFFMSCRNRVCTIVQKVLYRAIFEAIEKTRYNGCQFWSHQRDNNTFLARHLFCTVIWSVPRSLWSAKRVSSGAMEKTISWYWKSTCISKGILLRISLSQLRPGIDIT